MICSKCGGSVEFIDAYQTQCMSCNHRNCQVEFEKEEEEEEPKDKKFFHNLNTYGRCFLSDFDGFDTVYRYNKEEEEEEDDKNK